MFVSPINSINSKQCENSLPVKANLSVINHQINSQRSIANIRGCNSGSTGDSKKAMTNATTAKNNSDNVICYSAVTRYRQSFLPLQEAVHLHRCNSGVSQKEKKSLEAKDKYECTSFDFDNAVNYGVKHILLILELNNKHLQEKN